MKKIGDISIQIKEVLTKAKSNLKQGLHTVAGNKKGRVVGFSDQKHNFNFVNTRE
jgi:hypothetical protein